MISTKREREREYWSRRFEIFFFFSSFYFLFYFSNLSDKSEVNTQKYGRIVLINVFRDDECVSVCVCVLKIEIRKLI